MPQNPPNITESPEFKEFCKKNNLEVYDFDAIRIFLFDAYNNIESIASAHNGLVDDFYNPVIEIAELDKELKEENKKLREMIMEIAKNIYSERPIDNPEEFHTMTLFDKWNENDSEQSETIKKQEK